VICFVSLIFLYFICIKVSNKFKKKRYKVHRQSYRVGTYRNIYDDVLLCFHFENVFPISSHTHSITPAYTCKHHPQTNADQLDEKRWHSASSLASMQRQTVSAALLSLVSSSCSRQINFIQFDMARLSLLQNKGTCYSVVCCYTTDSSLYTFL